MSTTALTAASTAKSCCSGCGSSASSPCTCGGAGGCQCDTAACTPTTFVRPRFFSGQLLTEDDLQSLEDYVLSKNRLHNSRLFGEGVVCGFEVLCNPCGGGTVLVQPGYALDCCGNDIVLACKTELDINAMIRTLRRDVLGGYDCTDPCNQPQQVGPAGSSTAAGNPTGTVGATGSSSTATASGSGGKTPQPAREYCLYVRYCEQETDPVSPYAVGEPCSPQTCEPSRIREGLRFELRCPVKKPPPADFLSSIESCFKDLVGLQQSSYDAVTLLSAKPTAVADFFQKQQETFEDLRSQILDLIDRSPHLVHCNLRKRVLALQPDPPDPNSPATPAGAVTPAAPTSGTAYQQLVAIFLDLYKECVCESLLPPCPSCDDPGVLLACLKVRDCDVIEICNLGRRFVLSPVALRYWLGGDRLGAILEQFCCGKPPCPTSSQQPSDTVRSLGSTQAAGSTAPTGPAPHTKAGQASEMLQGILTVINAVSPQTRLDDIVAKFGTLTGLLGVTTPGSVASSGGTPGATSTPSADPATTAQPTQPAQPDNTANLLSQVLSGQQSLATRLSQVDALQSAVTSLQSTVESLQAELAAKAPTKRSSGPGGKGGSSGGGSNA
jgi:hypothetical protein